MKTFEQRIVKLEDQVAILIEELQQLRDKTDLESEWTSELLQNLNTAVHDLNPPESD